MACSCAVPPPRIAKLFLAMPLPWYSLCILLLLLLVDPNMPSADGLTPILAAIVSDQPAIVQVGGVLAGRLARRSARRHPESCLACSAKALVPSITQPAVLPSITAQLSASLGCDAGASSQHAWRKALPSTLQARCLSHALSTHHALHLPSHPYAATAECRRRRPHPRRRRRAAPGGGGDGHARQP